MSEHIDLFVEIDDMHIIYHQRIQRKYKYDPIMLAENTIVNYNRGISWPIDYLVRDYCGSPHWGRRL